MVCRAPRCTGKPMVGGPVLFGTLEGTQLPGYLELLALSSQIMQAARHARLRSSAGLLSVYGRDSLCHSGRSALETVAASWVSPPTGWANPLPSGGNTHQRGACMMRA